MNNNGVPTHGIDAQTLVYDKGNEAQVMWLDGALPLPTGSVIELYKEGGKPMHGNATVTGVRLLAATGASAAQVCLDVEVSNGWEANYEEKTS